MLPRSSSPGLTGRSSTPRPFWQQRTSLEYWIIRFADDDKRRVWMEWRSFQSFPVPSAHTEPFLHMFRRRRRNTHRFLVPGNRNSDFTRMQMQDRFAEARAVTVDVVADNGPALARCMHPQLMGAAGHG